MAENVPKALTPSAFTPFGGEFDQLFNRMVRAWSFGFLEPANGHMRTLGTFEHAPKVEVQENGRSHCLRHDPRGGGEEECRGGSGDDLERDQVPDLGVTREDEHAHRRADGRTRDVGADHHHAPRHPVADDAAHREHRDLGKRPRGEAEADGRGAAAVVEDREGDRDRREVRPDVRNRARREQVAKVAKAERAGHNADLCGLGAG